MKTICFLGTKRFNNNQKLKKKDVVVGEDNRVRVWMERSKTDSKREGCQFVLTKGKIGSVPVTGLIQWYLRSLGDISEEAFIFPVFRGGETGRGSGGVLLRCQEAARQGEGAAGVGRGHVALRSHKWSDQGFQEGGLQERHHAGRGMALFGCQLLHQGQGCGRSDGGCLVMKHGVVVGRFWSIDTWILQMDCLTHCLFIFRCRSGSVASPRLASLWGFGASWLRDRGGLVCLYR